MSGNGNGAVARVRVEHLLMDELAEAKERLVQMDAALADALRLWQLDKLDDPIQVQSIERLRILKDQEVATLDRLQRQMKAVQEGRGFDNEASRSLEVGS